MSGNSFFTKQTISFKGKEEIKFDTIYVSNTNTIPKIVPFIKDSDRVFAHYDLFRFMATRCPPYCSEFKNI